MGSRIVESLAHTNSYNGVAVQQRNTVVLANPHSLCEHNRPSR